VKTGVIVSHFGVKVLVEDGHGVRMPFHVARKSGHVVGDFVDLEAPRLKRLPRINELARKVHFKTQVIAANLDAIGIVTCVIPKTPRKLIDLVVVGALSQNIKPFIIVNKSDEPDSDQYYKELCAAFGEDISIFNVSAQKGDCMPKLFEFLKTAGRTAFIGVSGAGKSSLVNALLPNAHLAIGLVDAVNQHGQHMTTVSTMLKLSSASELIDTPGIRDFEPIDVAPLQLAHYFLGFKKKIQESCKFRNCLHLNEPECSIIQAVKSGTIKKERYENYVQMLQSL
jgi:ribosome biogenesis GTPase / thiamine phosphate phosphatase